MCWLNWGKNKIEKLKRLVEKWDKATKDPGGFSKTKNIKFKLFKKHTCSDNSKRITTVTRSGRNAVISEDNSDVLCEVAIWADRTNDGLVPTKVINYMQELQPCILFQQLNNKHYLPFLPNHAIVLKHKAIKEQITTYKLSLFNVSQQFCWRQTYLAGLKSLHDNNTGVCRKVGRLLGGWLPTSFMVEINSI